MLHVEDWAEIDPARFGPASDDGFTDAGVRIGQYLAGMRRKFDLPLVAAGADFQRQVNSRALLVVRNHQRGGGG